VDPTQKLVFGAKTRDANRQYEFNNNGEVDNGNLISGNSSQNLEFNQKPFSPLDEF
jgi:hypothetical protein